MREFSDQSETSSSQAMNNNTTTASHPVTAGNNRSRRPSPAAHRIPSPTARNGLPALYRSATSAVKSANPTHQITQTKTVAKFCVGDSGPSEVSKMWNCPGTAVVT